MKRLFLICFVFFSVASCSLGDDTQSFYSEFVPIESVDLPTEFVRGETYEMKVNYFRPSGCHVFRDFYYLSELNERTVAVINNVYPNNECQTLDDELVTASFNFLVTTNSTYVFRFWQGEDESGNDIYYIVEIPVVD